MQKTVTPKRRYAGREMDKERVVEKKRRKRIAVEDPEIMYNV